MSRPSSPLPPFAGGAVVLVLLTLFGGAVAAAQTPVRERVYVNLNGGYQLGDRALQERLALPQYDETATYEVRHASAEDVVFDAGVGLRMWSGFGVGLALTHFRTGDDVEVTGAVPDPLVCCGRFRDLSPHQPNGFRHTQLGLHVHAVWTIRIVDRLDVALSAGPSLFRVTQHRVAGIDVREVGAPYTEVEVAAAHRAPARRDVRGTNAGIDVTYHFVRRREPGTLFWTAGIGVFARWTSGTAVFPEFGSGETIEVGGLQGGLGLRFRF